MTAQHFVRRCAICAAVVMVVLLGLAWWMGPPMPETLDPSLIELPANER